MTMIQKEIDAIKFAHTEKIPQSEWKWFGLPAHFHSADECQFHLATQIGKFLISSVGDRYRNGKRIPLSSHYFETYVFVVKKEIFCNKPECNCGMPDFDTMEIYSRNAYIAGDAQKNHMEACKTFASMEMQNKEFYDAYAED
jgi:hypothetical protein